MYSHMVQTCYLKFVVAGAIQNHFPQNYISGLLDLDSEKDMNLSRSSENEMILQLAEVIEM